MGFDSQPMRDFVRNGCKFMVTMRGVQLVMTQSFSSSSNIDLILYIPILEFLRSDRMIQEQCFGSVFSYNITCEAELILGRNVDLTLLPSHNCEQYL